MKHLPFLLILMLALAGCTRESAPAKTATKPQGQSVDPRARTMLMEANKALAAREFHLAMRYLDNVEQYNPNLPEAVFLRGHVFLSMERLPEARAAFESLLARYATYEAAWHSLGDVAFAEGQFQEALKYYRREDAINPTPETWYNIGNVYRMMEQPDSAVIAFKHASRLNPEFPRAYNAMAEVHEDMGEFEEALKYARAALKRDPENPVYRYHVGAMLFRTDRAEEAEVVLRQAAEERPWDYSTLYTLGQTLQRLGRGDEATETLERAEKARVREAEIRSVERQAGLHRDSAYVHVALAEELIKSNRFDEALERYNVALTLDPTDLSVQQNVAAIHLRKGNTDEAISRSSEILRQDSLRVGAWVILSAALARRGDKEGSANAWVRALRIDPTHPTIQQAMRRP